MTQRVSGLNPTSYGGVTALTPPNFRSFHRAPTANDYKNFRVGALWLQENTESVWILTAVNYSQSLGYQQGTWTPISGPAFVQTLTGNTGGVVSPTGNNINVVGDGITVAVTGTPGTSTLEISTIDTAVVSTLVGDDGVPVPPLGGAIDVLATPTAGATVAFNNTAAHTLGLKVTDADGNTFVGGSAGNGTMTGVEGTALGFNAGHALTSGTVNCLVGHNSGSDLTTGSANCATGTGSLLNLVTGSNNISLGTFSSLAYTTSESDNIVIGNAGVIADANTIRIGTQGSGAGEQDKAYMAGVYQAAVAGTNEVVIVDNVGKFGSRADTSFKTITTQVFTASGTYTPTVGMKYCTIEVVGGGAGGGGSATTAAMEVSGGGGGGSGGYARKTVNSSIIGVSKAVTVGAGGAGGNNTGSDGAAGNATSVGVIVSASGGTGGEGGLSLSTYGNEGGVGGVGANGDFNAHGGPGQLGMGSFVGAIAFSGAGGNSIFGGGGVGRTAQTGIPTPGFNGTAYGGGGSGATSTQGDAGEAGGNGASGIVIITEYIS